jgi:hypothetical protein
MSPQAAAMLRRSGRVAHDEWEEPLIPTINVDLAFMTHPKHGMHHQIESEAEEVYVPQVGRGPGTKIDDILGYQRYLNVVGQIAQNNTDDNEPPRPNAKNF